MIIPKYSIFFKDFLVFCFGYLILKKIWEDGDKIDEYINERKWERRNA